METEKIRENERCHLNCILKTPKIAHEILDAFKKWNEMVRNEASYGVDEFVRDGGWRL